MNARPAAIGRSIDATMLALGACLALPSTSTVAKYTARFLGPPFVPWTVAAYAILAILGIIVVGRSLNANRALAPATKSTRVAELLFFLFLLLAFATLYPLANSGLLGGGGDRDEALDLAARALMHGHFPYYERTYLNGPISPLPGAVVLAAPFVAAGKSAYQNIFWLLAFYLVLKSRLATTRLTLTAMVTALCLSPTVMREFVTGSDVLCNGIYVLLFCVLTLHVAARGGWRAWGSAVLLGLGLASRTNFAILLPLIFSAMFQCRGPKAAIQLSGIAVASGLAVTLPFYFYDPGHFSPLHTANKLRQFESLVPFAQTIIVGLDLVLACVLALLKFRGADPKFLWSCVIVLAFPVVAGQILSGIQSGGTDFTFASYGVTFLFFAVLAAWTHVAARLRNGTRAKAALE